MAVGGDACTQQLLVPVRHNCGLGDMKKVAGKTKDISCHQKSKNTKYYFFGDGQSFEEIQDFASHALMLSVNAVLLFRVLSAADSRSSRFGACLYRCVVHSFALNGRKNKVTCISRLQSDSEYFCFTTTQIEIS